MYSNILVPISTEHADESKTALEAAQTLSSEGGKITILTVIEKLPMYVAESLPDGYEKTVEDRVRKELQRSLPELADYDIEIARGNPAVKIVDFSIKNKNDCIVIPAKGSGLEKFFLGSASQRVVRHAQCPVLVLR